MGRDVAVQTDVSDLSTISSTTTELLSSWENLLSWSENAGAARQMQEEMVVMKTALNRLGKQTCDFDSESSIQFGIEELKNEKTQLQNFRTNMLRLNASVHSWLTRQELKLKKELEALAANEAENNNSASKEKGLQINSIVNSESEFHKHLKDEVSEMYSSWDEADSRINEHLEVLTASLIAWRQLECGLSEFHQVLQEDRGKLKEFEGTLNTGRATPIELVQNVKLVAKLLSEKQQVAVTTDESMDVNRIVHITQFKSSNGSLSDSGMSDGGTTSDGGLSERERRLGALRRLAKQLQSTSAPNSDALKSLNARIESAEAELKTLQNTCRELIVRTAVSQHKSQALISYVTPQPRMKKSSPPIKRKNKKKSLTGPITGTLIKNNNNKKYTGKQQQYINTTGSGDPGDPKGDPWILCTLDDDCGDSDPKSGWAWRVAKIALPVQIALLTLFCAACLMEPHCCDSLNNLSMSFTPQLRYIRGPPPI